MARSLSTSGNKQVLIDKLIKCANNNVSIIYRSKIITLLPVQRQRITILKTISAPRGQAVAVNLVWIPLKPCDTNTATTQNNAVSHNLADLLGRGILF